VFLVVVCVVPAPYPSLFSFDIAVMKTLTVVSVVFVPMTFLSSVYGMNFADIPELNWAGSYPLFWAVVITTICGQMFFFRRRGWI